MQTQKIARVKKGGQILICLGILVFFIYSYQAIMDLEGIGHPGRQKSLIRIFTALFKPNLFEYEFETRETPIALESDCQNANETTQVVQVSERTVFLTLKCVNGQRATFTINGSGFQPYTPGYSVMQSNIPGNESRKFTASDFSTDNEGNFSITVEVIPMNLENIVSGRTIVVIEQLSKTFRGFSETSYRVAEEMWETIQIAFLATTFSAILAIPFTFFSARASSCWERGFNIFLQPILAAIRAVHPLIILVPAVVLTGIGPTAGVLALTFFSMAVLIVSFSEYAQQHLSLSWSALFRVYFPGLAFKHFPTNILIATILGIYGGGGIGFLLSQQLNLLNYRDAGVSILAIIIATGSLDLLSRTFWYKTQSTKTPFTSEKE